MSLPSNEMYLDYHSQKSNENPFKKSKLRNKDDSHYKKKSNKKKSIHLNKFKMFSNMYNSVDSHSHLLLIISVLFVSLFYIIILRVRQTYIVDKFYHSFCLGFLCLLDYLINREKYEIKMQKDYFTEYNEDSLFNQDFKKPLIKYTNEEQNNIDKENKLKLDLTPIMIQKRDLLIYSITLGILSFSTEMLIFYVLKITTDVFELNSSIGFALISFEYIFIRFYYSMEDVRIEFLNFLGLLMIFASFLFISIEYLSLSIGGLAFFISSLRFSKFYMLVLLNKYSNLDYQLVYLLSNIVDFLIGCICIFSSIVFYHHTFNIYFDDIFLMMSASVLYYINGKYFKYYDRYCLSISSLMFPLMILLDFLINNRRLKVFEIILIVFISCAVAMTFIGDKIWSEEEYLTKIPHHRDHHIFHYKNGRLFRLDSEYSEVSNENENEGSNGNKNELPADIIDQTEKVDDVIINDNSDRENKEEKLIEKLQRKDFSNL